MENVTLFSTSAHLFGTKLRSGNGRNYISSLRVISRYLTLAGVLVNKVPAVRDGFVFIALLM